MLSSARQQLLIVSIAALVLLANLGSATLFDEDEPKNAACGAEMFARGDWIVPTFNHVLRTDKPVLLYWLMLSSYRVLGVNELSARLPSALLAIGTVLMVYHLGRLLYRPQIGFWAAIILATSLMFGVVGRASTPDSTLIFFITAGALAYVRGSAGWLSIADGHVVDVVADWRRYLPKSIGWWIAMYVLFGLAVLTKGPVGVVLPVGMLATFLLVMAREPRAETCCASDPPGWRSRVRAVCWTVANCLRPGHVVQVFWALRPLTGIAVVALVASPWYLAVGLETDGQWLTGFLGKHNVNRFLQPLEGHRGTILYHPAVVHVTFFPWSMLLLLTLVTWWQRVRQRDAKHASDLFVACWAATYFVFFSLCRTKLPNYVLPAYPALALLTGVFLDRWIARPREVSRKLVALALGTYVCVGIGLVVVLPIVAYILLPGEAPLCLIGLIPLVGGALAWRHAIQERIAQAVHTLMVMGVVFAVTLFSVAAVRVARHQTSAGFATVAREQVGSAADWVTLNHFEPGLVFYSGNQVRHFDSLDAFEQQVVQSRNPVLLVRDKDLDQVRARLPGGFRELARQRRFLRRHDLVLLARTNNLARASRTGNQQSR